LVPVALALIAARRVDGSCASAALPAALQRQVRRAFVKSAWFAVLACFLSSPAIATITAARLLNRSCHHYTAPVRMIARALFRPTLARAARSPPPWIIAAIPRLCITATGWRGFS